ncbi:hypothetical protein [Microbispora sp. ATCC PTA-5024]|uniref:hypothetical protein n=1 Tax=Microbispora sp. ATCC PTA-5024 TaxID=316330 RepID=UPI0003DCBB3C|nr:hypothetical protein [Microbispora sp. ATCC PTA-5024]ETK36176.1 hypothetical protein MPTA5024_11155 [Microbispora sp. ATCC PTA-5024]
MSATHALKVAAAKVLADIVTEGYEQLRKEAEPEFAALRTQYNARTLDAALPDGTVLGTISILGGPASRKFNMSAIAAIVANDDPDEFVEQIRPEAVADPDLLAFVRDHMPHLLVKKIRDEHLKRVFKRVDENGYLKDAAGTLIKVAEVTRGEPTGEFRYKATPAAREAVWAAWEAGILQPFLGDLVRPAVEAGEGQ